MIRQFFFLLAITSIFLVSCTKVELIEEPFAEFNFDFNPGIFDGECTPELRNDFEDDQPWINESGVRLALVEEQVYEGQKSLQIISENVLIPCALYTDMHEVKADTEYQVSFGYRVDGNLLSNAENRLKLIIGGTAYQEIEFIPNGSQISNEWQVATTTFTPQRDGCADFRLMLGFEEVYIDEFKSNEL